ncbi:unnamed protein product [Phyllotreta striolata]|uniref:Uncharacterized protein n=1 Tax=Phyllotreta striolata TaxID=444603 RepID=A0A9N9XNW5_PHYSR|nr:unnamed protein product [Phyllotreta striolata]
MGAEQSSVDLRDYDVECQLPSYIKRVDSSFILAMHNGSYYPCIIIRPALIINGGYTVYFFHIQGENEVPANGIIGNLSCLKNCEVSYTDEKGNKCIGRIIGTNQNHRSMIDQPLNFFIQNNDRCEWVSFPYIYLTKTQAKVICC